MDLNRIQDALLTDGVGMANLSHISCNDETRHIYTLPKEDSKNI